LVLASTSRYRRELLVRLMSDFEVLAPEVDEAIVLDEAPPARATRLALEKARAVARQRPDAWVIGSDQVGALGDQLLDKPGCAARCRDQLSSLSGREATFYTGVALVRADAVRTHLDVTRVRFRPLESPEIERYIARDRPFDCAGSFKSEGLGISLLAGVATEDPSALIGLPLIWLAQALRAAGYRIP
jgi:septum formation protein